MKLGPYTVTVNPGPMAFLVFIVLVTVIVVFFAPAETAEQVLTPTGILALIAQGVMRQALSVERTPAPEAKHEHAAPEEGTKPDA